VGEKRPKIRPGSVSDSGGGGFIECESKISGEGHEKQADRVIPAEFFPRTSEAKPTKTTKVMISCIIFNW
jgi:hypothetical protein